MKEEKLDVYIKDEGYAAMFFESEKAKKWAEDQEIPNKSRNLEKYHIGVKLSYLKKFIKEFKKLNFIVESEISVKYI